MEEIYERDFYPEVKEIDQELAELLKKQSAKIKVVGVGGGGGTQDGGWVRAIGLNYRRRVIYYPNGTFHSKGNWQRISAY